MSYQPPGHDPDGYQPDGYQPDDFPPTFIGPSIGDITLVLGVPITPRDFSVRFSASEELSFAFIGSLPAGLSFSASGVLTGTPTTLGTSGDVHIEASGEEESAVSDDFVIAIILKLYVPAARTIRYMEVQP